MGPRPRARRLRRLPVSVVRGRRVAVAVGLRARILGLAFLSVDQAGLGLLIPRCRSVHTFGMRFALDLVFLDAQGRTLSVRRGVPSRRLACDRRAAMVLELPATSEPGSLVAGIFDPKGGETSPDAP